MNIIIHSQNGFATYLSDAQYMAFKVEATAGTAVVPNIFVPLVSADIKTVVNHSADQRMKGFNWKGNDLVRGFRTHEGTITVLADPDTLGHFLNMFMTKGSTTGDAANGYTHPFTVGSSDSYTIEISKGQYVQRYFGCYVDEMKLEFKDGQMMIVASIKAMGQFSVSTLGVALTGAGMTSATLDDEYDIAPNNGLVSGDVINIGGTDITLTSVNANGYAVGFGSTSVTESVGATVYLKPQSVSFATLQDPFYFGNCIVGFGVDNTAANTASGARSTATPVYDMSIVMKSNLFAQNGSNRLDPVQIIPRTREAQITLKQLFTSSDQRQAFLDREKQAITMVFWGKYIKTDFTTSEKLTVEFHNVKLIENPNVVEVGELIVDDQSFEVLYDNSGAAAIEIALINRSAGTVM